MTSYNTYLCDPITGKRDVSTQATVIADDSFRARKTYAEQHHVHVTDVLAIRADLDDRDSNGDLKTERS